MRCNSPPGTLSSFMKASTGARIFGGMESQAVRRLPGNCLLFIAVIASASMTKPCAQQLCRLDQPIRIVAFFVDKEIVEQRRPVVLQQFMQVVQVEDAVRRVRQQIVRVLYGALSQFPVFSSAMAVTKMRSTAYSSLNCNGVNSGSSACRYSS